MDEPAPRPYCFVLMPFGIKKDPVGHDIDFDAVYAALIRPAIEAAGMEPVRADEERMGGIIHKPMYERLILSEFAVADLTTANANVFYELGIRHALRPHSTVMLFAEDSRLPFDIAQLRGLPYRLTAEGRPDAPETARDRLAALLREAQQALPAAHELRIPLRATGPIDSPLFQLLDGYPDIDHERTDAFRRDVTYGKALHKQLAQAQRDGVDALRTFEQSLGLLERVEAGVVVSLFLAYRDVKAWDDMIALIGKMSEILATTILVQEQHAFALNRKAGECDGDEREIYRRQAQRILESLMRRRGPSSETYGLLGRVYKDWWEDAKEDDEVRARAWLDRAIGAYLAGFEADWRDAYPGVNAVTLMALRDPPDPRFDAVFPVVRYAVERRLSGGQPDYWDHATMLELAVLGRDEGAARDALGQALTSYTAGWQKETTARNLGLIRRARERRGEEQAWVRVMEDALA